MFWELPKVEEVLSASCKKWFVNNCKAYIQETLDISGDAQNTPTSNLSPEPTTEIVSSSKEKEQGIELGFVEN